VNVAEPVGDVGHGRVPADGLEGAFSGPAQRRDHPVGVVLNLGERDAFLAGEARRQRVITVRPQRNEPTVFDGGDHPAQRLTDAAERRLVPRVLFGHGRSARSGQLCFDTGIDAVSVSSSEP
jgi:hypothetical protein